MKGTTNKLTLPQESEPGNDAQPEPANPQQDRPINKASSKEPS